MITGEIARARCKTQIDIGFGDAVTPDPVHAIYPVLIEDLPAPRLRTYPVYTVVSEKLHAIALLGMTNSRLKDFLDIWVLLDREALNAHTLARAIATFKISTAASSKSCRIRMQSWQRCEHVGSSIVRPYWAHNTSVASRLNCRYIAQSLARSARRAEET